MKSYKVEGIVLKRINYGEADRILTIYTKRYGKIRGIAKGVRKLTSRKAGSLELFNNVVLFLVKGKNLDIITEAQTIDLFRSWRKNLLRVGVAYYFCELTDKLTPDEQPNQEVFNLLKTSLSQLSKSPLSDLIKSFEKSILTDLGFGIPKEWENEKGSLKPYIESIVEKKINNAEVLRKINEK